MHLMFTLYTLLIGIWMFILHAPPALSAHAYLYNEITVVGWCNSSCSTPLFSVDVFLHYLNIYECVRILCDTRMAYLGAYICVRTLGDVRMYGVYVPGMACLGVVVLESYRCRCCCCCCCCCFLHITTYLVSTNRWRLLHRRRNPPSLRTQRMA